MCFSLAVLFYYCFHVQDQLCKVNQVIINVFVVIISCLNTVKEAKKTGEPQLIL